MAVPRIVTAARPARTQAEYRAAVPRQRLVSRGALEMVWQPELEELERRREFARQMGGEANVQRQHSGGKLTVRERIDRLLDPDSFHEVGMLAGAARYENGRLAEIRPANFVMGFGRINGRRVVVG